MVENNSKENISVYLEEVYFGLTLIVLCTIISLVLSFIVFPKSVHPIGFQMGLGMGLGMVAFSGFGLIVARLGYMSLNKKHIKEAKNIGKKGVIWCILLIFLSILIKTPLLVTFWIWFLFGVELLYSDDFKDGRSYPGYDWLGYN